MSSNPFTDGNLTEAASTSPQRANALKVADTTFRLLTTGPHPLAVDGRELGHGLPAREVDLAELREMLLSKTATDALKDAVWANLVTRARSGSSAWTIGCVGVAMPGLKTVAARAIQASPVRYIDDIVSEMLTEFVSQLAHIDIQRPNIAPRLLFWARKGALRVRARERRHLPCDPMQIPAGPIVPEVAGPETVLKEAVDQRIISSASASLIAATRLGGASIQDLALEQGIPAHQLYRRRKAAEKRLVNAIRTGELSVSLTD